MSKLIPHTLKQKGVAITWDFMLLLIPPVQQPIYCF